MTVCGVGMGLCDEVKVRSWGKLVSQFPVGRTKPRPKCMGLRLESGRSNRSKYDRNCSIWE